MKVANKNVLVTGANRGIGRAVVEELLSKGAAKVYAAARNTESLPDFADNRVVPLALDITVPEQVRAAVDVASDVDLLINNAGVLSIGSLLDAPLDEVQRDMNVNYFGTLDVVRQFVPVLESRPEAALANVVTIAAFVNFPGFGGYSASKAALWSLSQGIRIELAPRGIAVHTVNPGPIDTDMTRDLPYDKATVEDTAADIVAGIENGDDDIFPDAGSRQMFEVWSGDYRQLEQVVYDMHHAA